MVQRPKCSTKRMLISLTPELHKLLFEYGEVFGEPAARCVVNLLEELTPQLRKSIELGRKARAGRLEEASKMLQSLGQELVEKAHQAQRQIELPLGKD